jgi:hypothetical protein
LVTKTIVFALIEVLRDALRGGLRRTERNNQTKFSDGEEGLERGDGDFVLIHRHEIDENGSCERNLTLEIRDKTDQLCRYPIELINFLCSRITIPLDKFRMLWTPNFDLDIKRWIPFSNLGNSHGINWMCLLR